MSCMLVQLLAEIAFFLVSPSLQGFVNVLPLLGFPDLVTVLKYNILLCAVGL